MRGPLLPNLLTPLLFSCFATFCDLRMVDRARPYGDPYAASSNMVGVDLRESGARFSLGVEEKTGLYSRSCSERRRLSFQGWLEITYSK